MSMCFRPFENNIEEDKAIALIATIDQGEKWIFTGAEGSEEFGGFIDRLYFSHHDIYGTYCSCIYNGKLRIHIGFNKDLPDDLKEHLLSLIKKARDGINSFTSIWYMPENQKLEKFLFHDFPWEARGHKTHEFTAYPDDFSHIDVALSPNITIIPFEEKYTAETCSMLDKSLAHTFDDPSKGVFVPNQDSVCKDWVEKSKVSDCCIMLEKNDVVGAYILKGAEIDFIAIAVEKQGQGLGKQLLLRAIKHILSKSKDNPFLYCIDKNVNAIRFYLREGMRISGHSGYAYLQKIT